jgi:hypothetical protein
VLSLSKNFPALHSALHGSSELQRDKGAAIVPAASQLLKPSPAYQQLSKQQVPGPAPHGCSTGADRSLAAAPETPSFQTGENFFFKKILSEYTIWEKIWSKLKTNFVPLKKYFHSAKKHFKSLFGRAPPL